MRDARESLLGKKEKTERGTETARSASRGYRYGQRCSDIFFARKNPPSYKRIPWIECRCCCCCSVLGRREAAAHTHTHTHCGTICGAVAAKPLRERRRPLSLWPFSRKVCATGNVCKGVKPRRREERPPLEKTYVAPKEFAFFIARTTSVLFYA